MSSYLFDAICSSMQFPDLRWNWDQNQPPIHVYYFELWSIHYKRYFYDICNIFLAPLHPIVFGVLRHRISFEARTDMKGIYDWFLCK
jgi:hypothetical protein